MTLRRASVGLVVVVLAAAACGDDDGATDVPSETDAGTVSTTESEATTAQTTTPTEEPEEGDAARSATLTIGDETWEFDSVESCGVPASPDTSSFVLIAEVGNWQLIAEVVDDSGEQRLEGDGVYDTINFQNNADPTMSWLANLEAAEVRFIVIDGSSVTASTTFDAVSGLSDDTPGTLEATCP